MLKTIRTIIFALLAFLIMTANSPICFAESCDSELEDYYSTVTEDTLNAIDDETKQEMIDSGLDGSDISALGIGNIFSMIWSDFAETITEPIKILGRLAAVLILSSLARSLSPDGGGTSKTFMTVSVLGCITVIYQSVYGAFENVCSYLDSLSEFMYSYIPIYASVTAASGSFTAGGSYYAGALAICELIGVLSKELIMPFLSVFLAFSFTAAINPDMKFSSAAESIKNAVRFTLTALMTLFTGLISVQSISGAAADNAAARAVKFGASSFIPIIGSSVSEAYSTVYASVGVIRSSVGTVGIMAVFVMLLKPLVTLLCVKLVLLVSRLIADIMGLSEASDLLKSTDYAMSAALSTVLCFSMMFVISTAIVMLTAR